MNNLFENSLENLLKNGDFSTGDLPPWTTTAGEDTWKIKSDSEGYYAQLTMGGSLSQSLPAGIYKPTSLIFEVRAGQDVKPGDFVIFSYAVFLNTSEGGEVYGNILAAYEEWREIAIDLNRKPLPANVVTVQVHTATNPEALRIEVGSVHFRNFRLIS